MTVVLQHDAAVAGMLVVLAQPQSFDLDAEDAFASGAPQQPASFLLSLALLAVPPQHDDEVVSVTGVVALLAVPPQHDDFAGVAVTLVAFLLGSPQQEADDVAGVTIGRGLGLLMIGSLDGGRTDILSVAVRFSRGT